MPATGHVGAEVSPDDADRVRATVRAEPARRRGRGRRAWTTSSRVVKIVGFVSSAPGLHRAARRDQRGVQPDGRGVRRGGPARAVRGRGGRAAAGRARRGRGDPAGPADRIRTQGRRAAAARPALRACASRMPGRFQPGVLPVPSPARSARRYAVSACHRPIAAAAVATVPWPGISTAARARVRPEQLADRRDTRRPVEVSSSGSSTSLSMSPASRRLGVGQPERGVARRRDASCTSSSTRRPARARRCPSTPCTRPTRSASSAGQRGPRSDTSVVVAGRRPAPRWSARRIAARRRGRDATAGGRDGRGSRSRPRRSTPLRPRSSAIHASSSGSQAGSTSRAPSGPRTSVDVVASRRLVVTATASATHRHRPAIGPR